jgi:hypothetical protein
MVDAYLGEYCAAHGMGPAEAAHGYMAFAARYQDDLRRFAATGRYPAEAGAPAPDFDRAVYDVFLLASVLATGTASGSWRGGAVCAGAGGRAAGFRRGLGLEQLLPVPDGAPVTGWDRVLAPSCAGASRTVVRETFFWLPSLWAPGWEGASAACWPWKCSNVSPGPTRCWRPWQGGAWPRGAAGGHHGAQRAPSPSVDFTDPQACEATGPRRPVGATVGGYAWWCPTIPPRAWTRHVVYALRRAGRTHEHPRQKDPDAKPS